MAERRYALTQLGSGRYMLHGNDVEVTMPGGTGVGTMFLLGRWEDGPSLGAERRRTRWTLSCAPWAEVRRAIERNVYGDPLDGIAWEFVGEYDTRRDAVEEAVRLSQARREERARSRS